MSNGSERIDQIFWDALQLTSEEERSAYLAQVCGQDMQLRQLVEKLLRAQPKVATFLEVPFENPSLSSLPVPTESAGTMIGPYRLLEPIGEGGMGMVWLAEQQEPVRRKVALKVIKPGMDSRQVVARFEAERQALAVMDHPHIARVFDGGQTTSGRPYFVMELVQGVPITRFCQDRSLSFRERLDLFIDVCQAVQHAHQRGIIHRDIKPSNVLVAVHDDRPVVKVIDFGIAKVIGLAGTDRTVFTQVSQLVGTPAYMSPEQTEPNNPDIDTRSDVYSLGVLLYELLTGTTPFDKERLHTVGYDEMRRIIREEEPVRPSSRLSTLGELAFARSRTPSQDHKRLSRLLQGEVDWIVLKALEKDRNRRYESAGAFALDVQRHLADEPVQACPPSPLYRFGKFTRRHRRALATTTVLTLTLLLVLGSLTASIGWVARGRALRRETVEREITTALVAAAHARDDAFATMNRPERWLARMQAAFGELRRAEVLLAGDPDLVRGELKDRMDALRKHLDADEQERQRASRLEAIRLDAATMTDADWPAAKYRDELAWLGLKEDTPDISRVVDRIHCSVIRGHLLAALDEWAFWERQSASLRTRLLQIGRTVDPHPWRDRFRDPATWRSVRHLEELAADPVASDQPLHLIALLGRFILPDRSGQVETLLRKVQESHPDDFWANCALAGLYERQGPSRAQEAIAFYRAALALRPNSVTVYNHLANVFRMQKDLSAATAFLNKAMALDPHYPPTYGHLAMVLKAQNNLGGAIAAYQKAIALDPNHAPAYSGLADALARQHKVDRALAAYRKAIALDPNRVEIHLNLGNLLAEQKDLSGAITAYHKALTLDPRHPLVHYNLGIVLRAQGNLPGAIAAYHKALEVDPRFALAYLNLGNALKDQNDLTGAISAYQRAITYDAGNALAYRNLGLTLKAQKDLPGAIRAYRQAIALQPHDASTHNDLGVALRAQNDLGAAVAAYRHAIELDPKHAMAHYNLGNALSASDDLPGAITAYRHAVALAPKHALAHYALGNALRVAKDLPGSLVALRQAVWLDPTHAMAHGSLGLSLLHQGQLKDAQKSTRRALDLLSKADRVPPAIIQQLRQCEHFLRLEKQWPALLAGDTQPRDANEWIDFARLAVFRGQHAKAVQLYQAAFARSPGLATSARPPHRYHAACAAVRAGTGQEFPTAELNVPEKVRLRQQALTWLQADCVAWGKAAGQQTGSSSLVRRTLRMWQLDPDLAGVREPVALERLSAEERQTWHRLWTEVERLVQAITPEKEKR